MEMTATSRTVDVTLETERTTDLAGRSPGPIGTFPQDAMHRKALRGMCRTDTALTTDHTQIITEAVANLKTILETASMMIGAIMLGKAGHRVAPEATVAAATGHPTATGKPAIWVLPEEATAMQPTTAGGRGGITRMLLGEMTGRVMGRSSMSSGEISRGRMLLTETGEGGMSTGQTGVHLGMTLASARVLADLRRPQRNLPRTQQIWVGRLLRLWN